MATRKTREELDQQMHEGLDPAELEVDTPVAPERREQPEETAEADEAEELVEPAEPEEAPAVPAQLSTILESLLFASGEPVALSDLTKAVGDFQADLTSREVKKVIEQLRVDLREQGRGVRIAEVAGGYQLRTPSETAPYVKKLVSRRPPRLTRATLETLAIVAYRQPATRVDVEEIRGVDSGAVLKHLLDKKLVKILGRKDEPGRPLVYGTTREFLSFFSLKDLGSLPTLRDFAELSEEHRTSLGLEPLKPEEEEAGREDIEEALKAEFTDAYTPVGEDEVVQELADAISELRKRDRDLRKVLPQPPKPQKEEDQPGAPAGALSAEASAKADETPAAEEPKVEPAVDKPPDQGDSGGA